MVIDQMEQFSRRLGELSSRVESTHEHTAQGLEQGARHRDQQLRGKTGRGLVCFTQSHPQYNWLLPSVRDTCSDLLSVKHTSTAL